jgi:hypothetical protein
MPSFFSTTLKDIRRRFGFVDVLRRGRHINQIGNSRDCDILLEFVLFGRGSDSDAKSRAPRPAQKVRHRGERADERKVSRLEAMPAPLFELVAMITLLRLGEKHRDELVSTLSDLAAHLLEGHVVTELEHRLLPSQRM